MDRTADVIVWWVQAGVFWSMSHQPAMRPNDAVVIAGKPFMDERLAETRQPVGPGTERVGMNS